MCVYGCVHVSNKNVHITLTKERSFASIAVFYRGCLKGDLLKLKWDQLYSVKSDSLFLLGFLIPLAHFHIWYSPKITSWIPSILKYLVFSFFIFLILIKICLIMKHLCLDVRILKMTTLLVMKAFVCRQESNQQCLKLMKTYFFHETRNLGIYWSRVGGVSQWWQQAPKLYFSFFSIIPICGFQHHRHHIWFTSKKMKVEKAKLSIGNWMFLS